YNRLVWIGVSILFLALAYFGYHFAERGMSKREQKKQQLAKRLSEEAAVVAISPAALPSPKHGSASVLAVLKQRTLFEIKQVVKSPAFFILMAYGLFVAFGELIADRDP